MRKPGRARVPLLLTVVFACALVAWTASSTAPGPIALVVSGRTIACDVPPRSVDGRVLVPIRAVSEALGCTVTWDQVSQRVEVTPGPSGGGSAGAGGLEVINASGLYATAAPSVVAIVTYVTEGGAMTVSGWGSGFVISPEGDVLTNAHVVEGADELRIVFPDGRSYEVGAQVLADRLSDLALIELGLRGEKALKLSDSDQVVVGEPVIAIGNPAAMQLRNTVTAGIVSGVGRSLESDVTPLIQTDAAINPGNSGGPLLNALGEVIGITNSKFVDESLEGLAFAIPINSAKQIVADLKQYGRVRRPWLGVGIASSPEAQYGLPTDEGLTVLSVDSGGPADRARVRVGDELMAVDGEATHSQADLWEILFQHEVGDTVTLTISRAGTTLSIAVTLGERPD